VSPADPQGEDPQQVGLLHWLNTAVESQKQMSQPLLVSAPAARSRHPRAGPTRRRRGRVLLLVVLGAGVIGAGMLALPHAPASKAPARRSAPVASAPVSPVATAACGPPTDPGVVRGNGPGGKDTGADTILWFEHSYYVDRNARKAREVVNADAAVSPVERLQSGIDSVPVGTAYCVTIRPDTTPGAYVVDIDETRQGQSPQTWHQRITTTARAGQTFITAIATA